MKVLIPSTVVSEHLVCLAVVTDAGDIRLYEKEPPCCTPGAAYPNTSGIASLSSSPGSFPDQQEGLAFCQGCAHQCWTGGCLLSSFAARQLLILKQMMLCLLPQFLWF